MGSILRGARTAPTLRVAYAGVWKEFEPLSNPASRVGRSLPVLSGFGTRPTEKTMEPLEHGDRGGPRRTVRT
ncbi:hypothetical protein [Actinoallomurus acaciae]|uniref:Uncharacterized protein n=1 Tax=Actinoallomurus acaciae TaxID=502577 RepID=A0ABV5YUM9_9ACTN